MKKMEQSLAEMIAQRESDLEGKSNKIKLMEHNVVEKLENEAIERKEQERRLIAFVDEKANASRGDLAKEAATREEECDNLKACLEVIY